MEVQQRALVVGVQEQLGVLAKRLAVQVLVPRHWTAERDSKALDEALHDVNQLHSIHQASITL